MKSRFVGAWSRRAIAAMVLGAGMLAATGMSSAASFTYSKNCTSYTTVAQGSNLSLTCNSTTAPVTQTPSCSLTASPASISAGGSSILSASCTPAATSYVWTNSGFGSTVAGGNVSPAATTTYTVRGSNSAGGGNTASAVVTVIPSTTVVVQALLINASTSLNKTSMVRIINTTADAGPLTATAFDESGKQLGNANASLGSIAANQVRTFSSGNLEQMIGFVPSAPTAKYSVYFSAGLSVFQMINYTRDNATGALTLSQSLTADRSTGSSAASVTRSAWFLNASTSSNKTSVLRILNTSTRDGSLSASLYDEAGLLQGSANKPLGAINAHQMVTYTSAQLESAMGFSPASPTAKYRVVFSANLPSIELINFTKDIASGNISLVQSQLDGRASSTPPTSTRNVLQVYPSVNAEKTTVLRIVNPNGTAATFTATAYNEAGSVVGKSSLGKAAANQTLALTSSQIETQLGYSPSSPNAKYRLVIDADVPSFEVLDSTRMQTSGNLYLAQAQTDGRLSGPAASTTRNAYIVHSSNDGVSTTELRIINTVAQSAVLKASAYDDNGALLVTGMYIGVLQANQMLTLTSAQLESLFEYRPPSGAKWRLVFSADLSNFELVNYAKEVLSGILVLAQPQTE